MPDKTAGVVIPYRVFRERLDRRRRVEEALDGSATPRLPDTPRVPEVLPAIPGDGGDHGGPGQRRRVDPTRD